VKTCFFSPQAVGDFNEILDYIGETDSANALDFVTRIQLTCDRIAQMPGMGRKRDDLSKGLRSFPVEKYVIFYRRVKDDIEIVRVLHGARNIETISFEK
jgi:toxin ParE1/3/4